LQSGSGGFGDQAERVAAELAKAGADLRICRNAVFARHGRIFSDGQLNRYFYGKAKPKHSLRPYFPFEPNNEFSNDLVSKTDWALLKVIDRAQAIRDPAAAASASVPTSIAAPKVSGAGPAAVTPKSAETRHPAPSAAPAGRAEDKGGLCAVPRGARGSGSRAGVALAALVLALSVARRRASSSRHRHTPTARCSARLPHQLLRGGRVFAREAAQPGT
jgi:hypothetical protein